MNVRNKNNHCWGVKSMAVEVHPGKCTWALLLKSVKNVIMHSFIETMGSVNCCRRCYYYFWFSSMASKAEASSPSLFVPRHLLAWLWR